MVTKVSIYKVLKELGLKDTRLQVLQIVLEEETGIRAQEVRQRLRDGYEKEISIQAVTKHLIKLGKNGFIKIREEPTDPFGHPYYVPNQTGIWLLKTTIDNVHKQYKFKPLNLDSKFRRFSIDFPFRVGQDKSLANFETNLIESEMEFRKDVVSLGPHWWFLKPYKDRVLEMMKKITHSAHEVTGICFKDNLVARDQARRAKGDLGINLNICSNSLFDNVYFYAYGPIFMMAFYPDDVNRKVTEIFQSHVSLEQVPKKEFEQMLEDRNPVRFAYAINEEFASQWRQQIKQMARYAIYP